MRRVVTLISVCLPGLTGLLAFAGPATARPADRELMQTGAPAVALADGAAGQAAEPVAAVSHRQMWMEVTAYCACERCCGPKASGVTASGLPVSYNLGRFAAADSTVLPLGTNIRVPGYHGGRPIPVIDRGGAIKGDKLDVFFPTHAQALQWGRRWVLVTIDALATDSADPA